MPYKSTDDQVPTFKIVIMISQTPVRYRTIGNGWSTGHGYESLYLQVAEQQGEMLISISN